MHAIKGGWVGQTFALAKCNDSGGKKSRIRRSKEERKSLVESFIKKHQKLNNGSFPSLNLTHKEVGGSFYTVREIVREVIQENKVLGPGNPDDILEQHLIGSFSIEHQSDFFSTNGPSANVEGLEKEQHHSLGDGVYLNGSSEIFQKNEEHERVKVVVSEDREILVLEEGVEDTQASCSKVTALEAALSVETSPLTSGSGKSFGLDDKNSVLNGKSGEKEGQSSVVDGMNFLENVSDLRNEQASLDLVDKNLVGKVEDLVEDNSVNQLAKEGTDISLNHHQEGSEEPDLNAYTQGLEYEHQSFGEGLEISGFGKASENNEKHEDLSIGYGDREITELEEKSINGSVLNKSLEKGESSVEEPVLNANTQGVEHEHQKFGGLQISGLGTASEKNEEHKDMCIEIPEPKEKTNNGSILNENLGKGELEILDETHFQQSEDLTEAKKFANIAVQRLENCRDLLIETEDKDASVDGIKIADRVNGVNTHSSKDAKTTSSKQTTPKAAISTQSNPNNRLVDDFKGPNPTLDRMNLESWKTTSDKHQKMPINPLLVYFKVFITAFVKFWSE